MALPRGAIGLQFVIVVFPDHTHLLFLKYGQNRFREYIIFMNYLDIIVKNSITRM